MTTVLQLRTERNSLPGGQVNDKLTAALEYAARGWPVFPVYEAIGDHCACNPDGDCKSNKPGKHPRTKHGLTDATTNPNQIRAWWARNVQANVAVAPQDFFVLDNDPRHGGDKTLAELEAKYGPLPETLRATSGGNGKHYLFNMPPGVEIRNVEGEDWGQLGLDIRGKGGYFLVEPSNHTSGGTYRWVNEGTLIADAPAWLVQSYLDRKAGRGRKPGETLPDDAPAADRVETSEDKRQHGEHWLGEASKKTTLGNRNDTGLWLACQLRDDGLTEADAKPFMQQYASSVSTDETNLTRRRRHWRVSRAPSTARSSASAPSAITDAEGTQAAHTGCARPG